MRIIPLILLLAVCASCGKKTNEINSYNSSSFFMAEKALVIPHNESGSVIRPKLLNKIVESNFPNVEINPGHVIQIHDELNSILLSENKLKDYEIKEKILTKVIVSFSDREEVYFVQERIPVNSLIPILKLKSESNRTFKLVSTPHLLSFFGATFYIVSLNHEDLMRNDQDFYNKESDINNFQVNYFNESFKKILIKVNYEFKVQSLSLVVYTAPKVRCSKELLEAGSCGNGCSFTTHLPINKYERVNLTNLNDLGLLIKYGDDLIPINELSIFNSKDGYFEVEIDSKVITNDKVPFQILETATRVFSNVSEHFNFSSNCSYEDRAKVSSYSLNTQVNINLQVNILGRGEELRNIKL